MKVFYFRVWHVGYVSTVRIPCTDSDLSTLDALKAKVCIVLFDHGLPISKLENVQSSELFYLFKNTLKNISHPRNLPNRTHLTLSEVVFDEDPDIFRVHLGDDVVLPVEVDSCNMRSLTDIEFFIKRRLSAYGVSLSNSSQFYMRHAKWTLRTPTRRDFKYRVVQISPVNFSKDHFINNVCIIQRHFRMVIKHRAALTIQHAYMRAYHKEPEWVHLA